MWNDDDIIIPVYWSHKNLRLDNNFLRIYNIKEKFG